MTTYVYFVRGSKHVALCRTSIESVRKADPNARVMVMTDEDSPAWSIEGMLYYLPSGMPIMLANLEAQVSALHLAQKDEPIVFLDSDILLLKPLPRLGTLTITWRDHVGLVDEEKVEGVAAQMPYNYGVIVAENCRLSMEAFMFMRERIRRMHSRHQLWYGNQLALAELAGPRPNDGVEVVDRRIPWMLTNQGESIRIAKIPGTIYNYTPAKLGEDISDKYALHFKGGARAMMESYAQRLGLSWKEAA
jgi:hypothetical protein